jgi:hypothetical protein
MNKEVQQLLKTTNMKLLCGIYNYVNDIENISTKDVYEYCKSTMNVDGIPHERCLKIIEHLYNGSEINQLIVINCHLYMEKHGSRKVPSYVELHEFNKTFKHDVMVQYEDVNNGNLDDICTLCCYGFSDDQQIYKLPCGHIFHRNNVDCNPDILLWINEHSSCPNCKTFI